MAAMLRGALQCAGDVELLFAIQRVFPDPRGGRSGRGWRIDERRRRREDPRRQHVRRQRRAGRHRGVAHRPDRTVLVRHPVPVEVGADRRTASGSTPLSVDDLQYFETRFFLVPGTGTVYVDAKLSVIRQRAVGNGFHEELTILNHDDKPVDLVVRLDADCDFADLFEVKDALDEEGHVLPAGSTSGTLLLGYERETFRARRP